ncbi:VOC family protein [Pseudonocardia alni]|uniref:VOC family protein n=1 Tax=Pseudonocardia alni TaxID=33907 RepID=UPI00280A77FB|nr:VOC family protein [Pseudonocardia alni]
MRLRHTTLAVDEDDAAAEYERLVALGVEFEGPPRVEAYGTVAVFRDVAGNRWDLLSGP